MRDHHTVLLNDLKIVLNKINDQNNTTIDIFSNMKEKVSEDTMYFLIIKLCLLLFN